MSMYVTIIDIDYLLVSGIQQNVKYSCIQSLHKKIQP